MAKWSLYWIILIHLVTLLIHLECDWCDWWPFEEHYEQIKKERRGIKLKKWVGMIVAPQK